MKNDQGGSRELVCEIFGKRIFMDKKEALKLLERYTDALKAKAEAEDGLSRIDSAYKIDESAFDVPFVKILTPALLLPSWSICLRKRRPGRILMPCGW